MSTAQTDEEYVSPSKLKRNQKIKKALIRRVSISSEPGLKYLEPPANSPAVIDKFLKSPSAFIDDNWAQSFQLPSSINELFSDDFIKCIPKTDLHLHLDGSIRLTTLIDLARKMNVELPDYTVDGLRKTVFKDQYRDLADYLRGFSYITAVMRTSEAMERVAYEVACDSFAEGVRYIEVRFAPQLHVDFHAEDERMHTIEGVIAAVSDGLRRAEAEYNENPNIISGKEPRFHSGIIVCAMRFFNEHFSPYYKSLLKLHGHEEIKRISSLASMALVTAAVQARTNGFPVVGLDIAGEEAGHPAEWHAAAYNYAHKNFLFKTVHAGEGFGPQSIFQALTDLHADRIGHGFHLFSPQIALKHSSGSLKTIEDAREYIEKLSEYVADRRITIEVCLTSNLQTMPELKGDLKKHNIRHMIDHRMSVTLGTDNRLVSNTTVCKEYRLACDFFNLNQRQLKEIVIAGFKRSFFYGSYKDKRRYVRSVIDYYERLEKQMLV